MEEEKKNPPVGGQKKELSLEELKKKLQECEKLKVEYLAGWQRSRADFLNYKKEELERMGEIIKYADTGLFLKILPILDNLELANKKIPSDLKNNETVKGLLQIKSQFEEFLKTQGVEAIDSLGQKFNPEFHEAIEEIESKDKEPGIILEEVQKGYKIRGQLLRPAKVRITK